MFLADEFYQLAHDEKSGRSLLSGQACGLGLSAALLAELMCRRHITVGADTIHLLTDAPAPPKDPLSHAVLFSMMAQHRLTSLRTWLMYLSLDAEMQVAERLHAQKRLAKVYRRRGFRQTLRYEPVDSNEFYSTNVRLTAALRRRDPLPFPDVFLLGLATATGLDLQLTRDLPSTANEFLYHLLPQMGTPLRELVSHTKAAVREAVQSYV